MKLEECLTSAPVGLKHCQLYKNDKESIARIAWLDAGIMPTSLIAYKAIEREIQMASYKELMAKLEETRKAEKDLYAQINAAREAHEAQVKACVADLTEIVKDGLGAIDPEMLENLKPLTIVVGADGAVVVRVGSLMSPNVKTRLGGGSRAIIHAGKRYANAIELVRELGIPEPASSFSAVRLLQAKGIAFEPATS